MDLTEELKKLKLLLQTKLDLSNDLKKVNEEIGRLNEVLTNYFVDHDIQNMKAHDRTFYLHCSSSPRIIDKDAVAAWLKDKGDYELLIDIQPQRFKGYYRELEESNEELPQGVEVYNKTEVRVRRS